MERINCISSKDFSEEKNHERMKKIVVVCYAAATISRLCLSLFLFALYSLYLLVLFAFVCRYACLFGTAVRSTLEYYWDWIFRPYEVQGKISRRRKEPRNERALSMCTVTPPPHTLHNSTRTSFTKHRAT